MMMRRLCSTLCVVLLGAATGACGPARSAQPTNEADAAPLPVEDAPPELDATPSEVVSLVEIGVPGGPDGLSFAPLPEGAELRLQSFGQGGTHVLLGVRCIDFGHRASIALTLTNMLTSVEVSSPPPVRPQLLLCVDERTCDLVPILAMAGGLTEPGVERNGLPVRITAQVHNEAGLAASATRDVVLSTADL
jgi:hypothetical protein